MLPTPLLTHLPPVVDSLMATQLGSLLIDLTWIAAEDTNPDTTAAACAQMGRCRACGRGPLRLVRWLPREQTGLASGIPP